MSVVEARIRRQIPAMIVALAVAIVGGRAALAGVIHYSFFDGETGGVAELVVDGETGGIASHRALFTDSACRSPHKLARSGAGRIVLVNQSESGPNIYIYDEKPTAGPVISLTLEGEPDEIRIHAERAFVGVSNGSVVAIDLAAGAVERIWRGRTELDPPGRRPEDLRVIPERGLLAVSFQKDNSSGRLHGNRVVLLDLFTLETVADLQLPRSMPELHNPANRSEQGPGPEVVLHSIAGDALMVSLDLYGAVAVMDLNEAVAGRFGRLEYLPTDPGGAFGDSFPDRFSLVSLGGRELALALNAGSAGGGALIDLETRAVVARFPAPHGLETPVHLPTLGVVMAAGGGKLKQREPERVRNIVIPRAALACIDLAGVDPNADADANAVRVELIPMPGPAPRLARASAAGGGALLVVAIDADERSRLIIFDAAQRAIVGETPAFGSIVRMIGAE